MPGHLAPAYVATVANSLITRAAVGWFGGLRTAFDASRASFPLPGVCGRAAFSALCAPRVRM